MDFKNELETMLKDMSYVDGKSYLLSIGYSYCVRFFQEDSSRPRQWSASVRFNSPDNLLTVKFYVTVWSIGRPKESDLNKGNWWVYYTPAKSENPGERIV